MNVTKLVRPRFTAVLSVTIALGLTSAASSMTSRPSVKARELPCSIEVQTLPGSGGFVPRVSLFNPGPPLPSGTLIRYRLTQGRPDRFSEIPLVEDLGANASISIVVYPALGYRLCTAITR